MDRKLLHGIMRKFLDTRKNAEIKHKVFAEVDGVDFYAQVGYAGLAIMILNRHDARTEKYVKFIEPQTSMKEEVHELFNYPNVPKFFQGAQIERKPTINIPQQEWEELVAIHKAMDTLKSFHGINFACKLVAIPAEKSVILKFQTINFHSINFEYKMTIPQGEQMRLLERMEYHYDPSLLLNILESTLKVKSGSYSMHLSNSGKALFITSHDSSYKYFFALAKRLTEEESGDPSGESVTTDIN
jgi:hypothetical protein